MTSKRKIRANQENAKKSTGPGTPQGKRTSSQNAYKHGIWAKQLAISDDEREDYEKLVADLDALLKPEGPILQYYFDEIVLCMWRLRMLVPIESRQLVLPPPQLKQAKETEPFDQGSGEQNVAEQASVLDELRKRLEAEAMPDAEMRNKLLRWFGEEFTAVVDKLYPTQRAYSRSIALATEQKAITYGDRRLLDEAEKLKRHAGIISPEEQQEGAPSDDEILRRQEQRAIDKDKKILLTFIDHEMELVRARQLQSEVKLQHADSVLVRFDLQLRYRAALTRDLRKAIEAFLHYNRSLRPGK